MDKDTLRGRSSWPSSNTVPYSPPSSTCTWGFYFISHCHPHFKYRHKCLLLEIPKYYRPEEKRQRPITAHGQLLLHTMFSPVLWFWAFAHATHCLPQVLFLPFLLCNPLLISLIISYVLSLFCSLSWSLLAPVELIIPFFVPSLYSELTTITASLIQGYLYLLICLLPLPRTKLKAGGMFYSFISLV